MGTNYYVDWNIFEGTELEHLEGVYNVVRTFRRGHRVGVHIGKSSGGWTFAVSCPQPMINCWEDWKQLLLEKLPNRYPQQGWIWNEYGEDIGLHKLITIVERRSSAKRTDYPNQWYQSEEDFMLKNHCVPGPNGLVRGKQDHLLISHGSGTWDNYKPGFS